MQVNLQNKNKSNRLIKEVQIYCGRSYYYNAPRPQNFIKIQYELKRENRKSSKNNLKSECKNNNINNKLPR